MARDAPSIDSYGDGGFRLAGEWHIKLAQLAGNAVIERYVSELTGFAHTLVGLIAAALNVPRDELMTHFAKPTTFLRLLRYPPQRQEDGLFGSAPHTDYGFITLLAQDEVGGLEVRNRAGEWIAAPPIPDTFVINVGDILAHTASQSGHGDHRWHRRRARHLADSRRPRPP